MEERWRDLLVFLLLVAVAAGSYVAARTTATDEPLPMALPLLCVAACVTYKLVVWLLDRVAVPRVEFDFPVYVLRDPAGQVLCTEEPDGGYLAVFTSADTAARFREVRSLRDWSPAAFGRAELLDVLQFARRSGRVQYVVVDPLVGQYGFPPVFPLARCVGRLRA